MARGKRVEIVKVPIIGPYGATMEVDGKMCTKCGEVKALIKFYTRTEGSNGRYSACKKCTASYQRERTLTRNSDAKSRKLWTEDTFLAEVNTRTGGEYIMTGVYINTQVPTEIRHNVCGTTYSVAPCDFLRGHRCRYCAVESRRKSPEQFECELRQLTGSEYRAVGMYLDALTPIDIFHSYCGNTYPVRPNDFLRGRRCPYCFGGTLKPEGQYVEEVEALVGSEYSLIGKYVNASTRVTMRHNVCGEEYPVQPRNFLRGDRCPACVESRGERRVREYLTANSHVTTPQYKFDECRDINPLPFDFAVHFRNYDVLIEYDGEQHSRPVDFAGKGELWALEQFRETQRRDRIKDDYCRANGIDLIRIRYDQFDEIETILDRELSALGVTGSHPTEDIAA